MLNPTTGGESMPRLSCLPPAPLGAAGLLLRVEGAGRAAQGTRGFARAAQRVALMVRRDLRLNLASADVPLLPLGIWFDSGFWPVSNSSHRLPTAVLKGFCVREAMEKSLLENAAVGKDSYKMTVKKAFFCFVNCC